MKFNLKVPDFRGATLHEGTEWHEANWPPAPQVKEDSQQQVYAYERLKQEMERLKKHDDEQFFFRKELRARRGLVPRPSVAWLLNFTYEILSDYGQSVVKPLLWLFVLFVIGGAFFAWASTFTGTCMTLPQAASFSFANTFLSFLPVYREVVPHETFVGLSSTARIIVGVQCFLGTLLLFLLGLALRNRFRMK